MDTITSNPNTWIVEKNGSSYRAMDGDQRVFAAATLGKVKKFVEESQAKYNASMASVVAATTPAQETPDTTPATTLATTLDTTPATTPATTPDELEKIASDIDDLAGGDANDDSTPEGDYLTVAEREALRAASKAARGKIAGSPEKTLYFRLHGEAKKKRTAARAAGMVPAATTRATTDGDQKVKTVKGKKSVIAEYNHAITLLASLNVPESYTNDLVALFAERYASAITLPVDHDGNVINNPAPLVKTAAEKVAATVSAIAPSDLLSMLTPAQIAGLQAMMAAQAAASVVAA